MELRYSYLVVVFGTVLDVLGGFMQLKCGDMWTEYGEVDLFCITTNSDITKSGRLVMGRGIAYEAKQRIPDIDLWFGNQINEREVYGLIINYGDRNQTIGAFQVKRHYYEQASIELIKKSCGMLFEYLLNGWDCRVIMNFPGIGNGHLDVEEVLPIVSLLPDNVTLWLNDTAQYNKCKDILGW